MKIKVNCANGFAHTLGYQRNWLKQPDKNYDKQKGILRQLHKTISRHFSASALYTESL